MEFPIFHLDGLGNRGLIAIIAILHVLINHGLAVGMMPLVAAMEWYGKRSGDQRWDTLAYKLLFFAFLITTTVGALTGVGIWFSTSLVNPYSIGSLIRVFFWGWFIEWLVFITEVVLILAYFLTWKKWTGERKNRHIQLGFGLAFFSWVTMSIIVSILGFMMDPGNWLTNHTLWEGFTNPVYLPQLAFRTPLALAMAGVIALTLILFFTKWDDPFRPQAIRAVSLFTLMAAPFVFIGGYWYYEVLPQTMADNLATGLLTIQFTQWQQTLLWGMAGTALLIALVAQFGVFRPQYMPRFLLPIALLGIIWLTGHFERVREFVRKPYVIGQYMYANGLRVEDHPLYARDGILPWSSYSYPLTPMETAHIPTDANTASIQDGKDVFMIACSRCHTSNGVNSVTQHFQRLFGDQPWTPELTMSYMEGMHEAQPFMPPFPGNHRELESLASYIATFQHRSAASFIEGAQNAGTVLRTNSQTMTKAEIKP
ncbi:mono/diheme cytochrome c family protein [Agrobacterium vitis]|nr:mono/diheme cytochrome c family protein [Agrobacterium vitis]MBE1440439.1 mono/diheme cytochrome c family protein [Agrobacterium vitis]